MEQSINIPKDVAFPNMDIENVIESKPPEDGLSKHIESVFMKKFGNRFKEEGTIIDDIVEFSNLPDTILLKIFSNFSLPELCHIALVCKHWMWIVYDSELWKYVDLSGYSKITEQHIVSLINARLSPLLKTLDLSNREITPVIINALNQNCQQLDTLVLQNCLLSSTGENKELELLKSSVPDKLVRLDIRNLKKGFHFIHLILEASDLSNIECFGFGSNHFCPAFSDFHRLFRRMHSLRILECVNCETVNDAQVQIFANELPCLESLVLKKCTNINGSSISHLLVNAKSLKSLNLSETCITDAALTSADWGCCKLEELDFSFCWSLTQEGLLESIPKIQSLQYIGLHNVGKSRAVTPEVLEKVVELQSWRNLEVFCLRFCNKVSNDSIQFIQNCKQLKYLSFRTCFKIGFSCIASTLKYLPNLVTLECGSLRISEESICSQWIQIFDQCSQSCLHLQQLVLVKCSNIPIAKTSEYKNTMIKFLKNCKGITSVCILYSEESILSLLGESMKSLQLQQKIIITSTPLGSVIPPFRHSLDTELNRRRFQSFSY